MRIQEARELVQQVRGDETEGYLAIQEASTTMLKKMVAFRKLKEAWAAGKVRTSVFEEALTSADYPLIQGNNLSRDLQALYATFPMSFESVVRPVTVPDFKDHKFYPHGLIDQVLTKDADDATSGAPSRVKPDSTSVDWGVKSYTGHTAIHWQTLVNDDMGYFDDIPQQWARAARRTEQKVWTELHFDVNGPTGLTQIPSNPVFNIAGLKAGIETLMKQVDANGEPILIDAPVLEVGPALAVEAQEILRATTLEIRDSLPNRDLITSNWVGNFVQSVIVNPYIPIVASTSNTDTSWCLLASGSSGRAAFEWGTLRGFQEPKILVKAPDAQAVGGGLESMVGSFSNGNIEYKVIHVLGGALVDSQGGVMSNGSGS